MAVSAARRFRPAWDRRVTGTIVEARTGVPLAAVLVKVQSTGQQAFSDADGRFEIARRSRRTTSRARLRCWIRAGETGRRGRRWRSGGRQDCGGGRGEHLRRRRRRRAAPHSARRSRVLPVSSCWAAAISSPSAGSWPTIRSGPCRSFPAWPPATTSAPSSPCVALDRRTSGSRWMASTARCCSTPSAACRTPARIGLINSDIIESATLLRRRASAASEFASRLASRLHHA